MGMNKGILPQKHLYNIPKMVNYSYGSFQHTNISREGFSALNELLDIYRVVNQNLLNSDDSYQSVQITKLVIIK